MLHSQLDNLLCDDLQWPTSSIWVSNVHFVVWSTTLSLGNPNIIFWGFSPQTKINSQLVTYIITQIEMFVYLCMCDCVDVHACSVNIWMPIAFMLLYLNFGFQSVIFTGIWAFGMAFVCLSFGIATSIWWFSEDRYIGAVMHSHSNFPWRLYYVGIVQFSIIAMWVRFGSLFCVNFMWIQQHSYVSTLGLNVMLCMPHLYDYW